MGMPQSDLQQPKNILAKPGHSWSRSEREAVVCCLLDKQGYRELLANAKGFLGDYSSREDVEDAVDDFFVKQVNMVIDNYKPERGSFKNYFLASLRHFCWRYKKVMRMRLTTEFVDAAATGSDVTWAFDPAVRRSAADADADARFNDLKRTINTYLAGSPKMYEVFVMFYYREMGLREISKHLRITETCAKVRLFRARQILRGPLAREGWVP